MNLSDDALTRLGGLVARENAPLGLLIHDRYEVLRRLARGGMGEIFIARDVRLHRPVAMKILASGLSDPEWAARFEDEARTMGRIDHPGVVPIHDLGLLPDGRLYYTMKLIEGSTLDNLIKTGADRRRLVRLLARVSEVVHQAHEKGIIHRDLKPSNVMVGTDDQVFVLDWGIARVMEEYRMAGGEGAVAGMGLTSAGTILGTLQYMPPEQARGDIAAIDARSDVYSLGAILYEMLTRVPPIEQAPVTETLEFVTKGEILPPRLRDPSIPPDLEAIALRALSTQQASRYPTAKDLGADLSRWLDGEPVQAHSSGLGYRVGKKIAKRRAVVVGALLFAASVAAAAGYWLSLRAEARGWVREAESRLESGDYLEARRLFDQARARIPINAAHYSICEVKIAEDRARAEEKRREDDTFGPIRKHLEGLPQNPDGWKRGVDLLSEGLSKVPSSWDAWMKKAEWCEKLGRWDDALEANAQAAALNPKLGMAHYRRGKIFMDAKNKVPEAVKEFEEALKIEPDNEFAQIGQARIAFLQGKGGVAFQLCQKAEALAKHIPDFYFVRGYMYACDTSGMIRDRDKAILDFNKLIEMEPHNALAYANRGFAKDGKGDLDGAIADYNKALELNSRIPGTYNNRGIARGKKGDRAGHLADLNKCLEIDPRNLDGYYNRATYRHDEKDYAGAIEDYTKIIEYYPQYAGPWADRAHMKYDMGDLDGAIADCTKALQVQVFWAPAYEWRATCLWKKGLQTEAFQDWGQAISYNPKSARSYKDRGRAYWFLDKLDEARKDLSRAIELEPREDGHWATRGKIRGQMNDLDGALEDLTKAIALAPSSAEHHAARGELRDRKRDFEGALADFTKAIELSPKNARYYNTRGQTRRRSGDREGALADHTRAIELDPQFSAAWTNRGNCRWDAKDYDGAIADHTRAIEVDPKNAVAYINRAIARAEKGDGDGVRQDFKKAVEIDPANESHYRKHAEEARSKGDLDDALNKYTQALKLNPEDAESLRGRAEVYMDKKEPARAVDDFLKSLLVAPKDWKSRDAVERKLQKLRATHR